MGRRYDQAVFAKSQAIRDIFEMSIIANAIQIIGEDPETENHDRRARAAAIISGHGSPYREKALDFLMMEVVWMRGMMDTGVVVDGTVYPERLDDGEVDTTVQTLWDRIERIALGPQPTDRE